MTIGISHVWEVECGSNLFPQIAKPIDNETHEYRGRLIYGSSPQWMMPVGVAWMGTLFCIHRIEC